jgi:DNA-binding IclR family transcriptional regulator
MTKRERDRQGIQSIEVGARLLSALAAAPQAQSLSALASAAGMPASKAHRYLVSFGRSGLIIQDTPSGRYDVGPLAVGLGLAALSRFDIVRHCANAVDDIRDVIDETVGLFVWATRGPTIVRLAESSHPVAMTMRVGSTAPLISTASGRIFAAFLPEQLTRDYLSAELAAARAKPVPGVPQNEDELRELLDTVRRRGMARVAGEFLAGVGAFSVPVFGHEGDLKATITAVGRAETLDITWNGPVAQALKAYASRLSGAKSSARQTPQSTRRAGRQP